MNTFVTDLTGQVEKTGDYYFAYGGQADIWMGGWSTDDRQSYTEVRTHPFLSQPVQSLDFSAYR
jgi:hypothetical protein